MTLAVQPSLQHLPHEIYDEILQHLDRVTLASVCQASRKLHSQTFRKLYCTLEFDLTKRADYRERPLGVALALRSIATNPVLAEHVEHLAANSDWPLTQQPPLPEDVTGSRLLAWETNNPGHDKLRQEVQSGIEDQLSACFTQEIQRQWLELLAQGRLEVVVACLVLKCRNLKSLRIGSLLWVSGSLDLRLAEAFANAPHDALSSVTLCPDIVSEIDVWLHTGRYTCLDASLSLPAIEYFSAPLPELYIRAITAIPTTSASFLKKLALMRTHLSEESLGVILRCTPQLKALTFWSCYPWGCNYRPGRQHDEYLDCDRLGRSLLYVQDSLEELSLSFMYFDAEADIHMIGIRGSCGSLSILRHFKRLKTLAAPFLVLLGWYVAHHIVQSVIDYCLRCDQFTNSLITGKKRALIHVICRRYFHKAWKILH